MMEYSSEKYRKSVKHSFIDKTPSQQHVTYGRSKLKENKRSFIGVHRVMESFSRTILANSKYQARVLLDCCDTLVKYADFVF